MLTLNDTVYTHPASIIPFHTSPGLFICLRLWGDMKARALLPLSRSPFCLLFFPPTTAGSSWPLIYEGLLNPCGSVSSPPGNFGVRCRSVVKTEVIYSSTCLTLLGRGEDAAAGTVCQLLDLAPSFCWCVGVCV